MFRTVTLFCLIACSSGAFPGGVPNGAERVEKTVVLKPGIRGWHSTGLYAAPGNSITIDAPEDIASYKLRLRIGCHKDKLKKEPGKRPKVITVSTPLTAGCSTHSNEYGGLVYIEVPPTVDVPALSFTIIGAVPAPYYVHGITSFRDWKNIRNDPAPWAELESDRVVQLDELRSNTNGKNWGYFHEFGHNHQSRQWTFQGTGEVTCNLFSLFTIEKVCGGSNPHRAMAPKKRRERLEQYLAEGADFELWKKDPFLALTMYVQLQEAFGWQPFMELFADYQKDPIPNEKGKRRPSDELVRDEWMVRFSKKIGRNLGPFFEVWGVPSSEAAREAIAHLPQWMPAKMQ